MKDTKRKTLIKAAKKEAKKTIQKNLITGLTKIALAIGSVSNKFEKTIAKEANKLAKRMIKQIHLDEVAIAAGAKSAKAEPDPVIAETKKAKTVPAKKTAAPKAETIVTAS